MSEKNENVKIQVASVEDAEELLAIYAPYVEKTAITFEYEVPSVEEFKGRIAHVLQRFPYLKAVEDGKILGYAYVSPFKERAAYDWSVETSIYVDENGKPYKTAGKIDYVSGWYFKAASFMQGTAIRTAFVSTNSITQGEQVAGVWKPLYDRFGIHVDFAYRTFRWDSEASLKAHVHCVIVGFSVASYLEKKWIFTGDRAQELSMMPV